MGSILNTSNFLIDTNIIIDYLRGRTQSITFFKTLQSQANLLTSTITVTELYAGVKTQKEEKLLNNFLQNYHIIDVDHAIARKGGLIKKRYGPSHGIGIADAVIAATALEQDAKLITLNLKHFPMITLKEAPY